MSYTMRTPFPVSNSGLDFAQRFRVRSCARPAVCALGDTEGMAPARRAAVLLAFPLLLAATPAKSAFIDLSDVRNSGAKETMLNADQARDTDLDQRLRFSYQSVDKLGKNDHRTRAKESFARLQRDVKVHLDRKQFPKVSRELGNQMGSLRYDLQQLANDGDKSTRKTAQAQTKQAIKALEELDLYARLNKPAEANEAYTVAVQKLGDIVKSYG